VKMQLLLLMAAALLAPGRASATPKCPWLTEGSAANALGGKVSAAVQASSSGEGSCTFTRDTESSGGAAKDTLKIVVQKAEQSSCPAGGTTLKGIGNEAVRCKLEDSPVESVDVVVSRVREMHFSVTMATHKKRQPDSKALPSEDVVARIAEQVAGNLF
jgi:hypothetical protein